MPDDWAATKWRRDLERFLVGKKCPMCGCGEFRMEEERTRPGAFHDGPHIYLVPAPAPPRAEAWCKDCGYILSFVVL